MGKKKAAKKAKAKEEKKGKKKDGSRKAHKKADEAAVKEYQKKYETWETIARNVLAGSKEVEKDAARKVLAAKKLMELAGGYDEAFVILDAVMIVQEEEAEEGK